MAFFNSVRKVVMYIIPKTYLTHPAFLIPSRTAFARSELCGASLRCTEEHIAANNKEAAMATAHDLNDSTRRYGFPAINCESMCFANSLGVCPRKAIATPMKRNKYGTNNPPMRKARARQTTPDPHPTHGNYIGDYIDH